MNGATLLRLRYGSSLHRKKINLMAIVIHSPTSSVERVIGYDNGEGKGDHRHHSGKEEAYRFESIDKLFDDFLEDVRRYKK